jgi:hypothetical protein
MPMSPSYRVHATWSKASLIERELNRHKDTIQTSEGPAAQLGLDRLNKALSMPKAHADQVFALCGNVAPAQGHAVQRLQAARCAARRRGDL